MNDFETEPFSKDARLAELLELLLEMLESDYSEAQNSAVVQLVRNFGREAVPSLVRALELPGRARSAYDGIVTVLGLIGDARAVPALVAQINADDAGHGDSSPVIEALAKVGGNDALASIVGVYCVEECDHSDEFWTHIFDRFGEKGRRELVRTLERTRPAVPIPSTPPRGGIGSWGDPLRLGIVTQLARLDDGELRSTIGEMLKDPEADVRARAAAELGALQDSEAVPDLIDALSDEDWRVVEAAAGALGRIGDPAALQFLVKLLDPDLGDHKANWEVRSTAEESLLKFGPDSVPALSSMLEESNNNTRQRLAGLISGLCSD